MKSFNDPNAVNNMAEDIKTKNRPNAKSDFGHIDGVYMYVGDTTTHRHRYRPETDSDEREISKCYSNVMDKKPIS